MQTLCRDAQVQLPEHVELISRLFLFSREKNLRLKSQIKAVAELFEEGGERSTSAGICSWKLLMRFHGEQVGDPWGCGRCSSSWLYTYFMLFVF